MNLNISKIFKRHFEWVAFTGGLIALGLMNPYVDQGSSLCFFDILGIPFCPGEGLGHSIAYTFRGDLNNALHANIMGPIAIIILLGRIGYLIQQNFYSSNCKEKDI